MDQQSRMAHHGGVCVLSNPLRWSQEDLIKNVAFCRQLVPVVRRLLWFIYECGEEEFLSHCHYDILTFLYSSVSEIIDVCGQTGTLDLRFIPVLSLDRVPQLIVDARSEAQASCGCLMAEADTHNCKDHHNVHADDTAPALAVPEVEKKHHCASDVANPPRNIGRSESVISMPTFLRPGEISSCSWNSPRNPENNGVRVTKDLSMDEDVVFFSNPTDSKIAHKVPIWSVSLSMKVDPLSPKAAHLSLRRVSSANDSLVSRNAEGILNEMKSCPNKSSTAGASFASYLAAQPPIAESNRRPVITLVNGPVKVQTDVTTLEYSLGALKTDGTSSLPSLSMQTPSTGMPASALSSYLFDLPIVPRELQPQYRRTGKFHRCNRVLFAGTFDHLHSGHKTMLTFAAYMTRHTLIMGVTTRDMLNNKTHKEALEPYYVRALNVKNFLKQIKPPLLVEFSPISDPIGPSGEILLDALMVTKDSMPGGEAVNRARKRNCLPPVKLVRLDMVPQICNSPQSQRSDGNGLDENLDAVQTKMSSSYIRQVLLNHTDDPTMVCQCLKRWDALMTKCCVPVELGEEIRVRLLQNYAEAWRHYHTMRYLHRLLELFDAYSAPYVNNIEVILLAIWFQKSIYCPRLGSTNKLRSASLFTSFTRRWKHWLRIDSSSDSAVSIDTQRKCIDKVNDTVVQYILHTDSVFSADEVSAKFSGDDRRDEEWISDLHWIIDLDRAVFAEPENVYNEYAAQVRKEFFYLDEDEFSDLRVSWLRDLCLLPRLFAKMPPEFETRARANISKEIERLTS